MKNFKLLREGLCILFLFAFAVVQGNDVLILDENIQAWKTNSAYKDVSQEVFIENETKLVELYQVIVKSTVPSGIEEQGPCTAGFIQMSKDKESKITLPTIKGGISRVELHIITAATASRTVDVKVLETSKTETLSGLNKNGDVYSVNIGTTGNTTICLENVTGGIIYITDIKIYQKKGEIEISSDATLSSLSYKINNDSYSISNFDSKNLNYNVSLSSEVKELPIVFGTTNHKDAGISYTQIGEIPGTAIVRVNASDGVSTKEYKISFAEMSSPDAVASLPLLAVASKDEPLQNQIGFKATYLGTPMADGSAKFEGSKAITDKKPMLVLQFNSEADKLSFDIKGNNAGSPSGFEGANFIVEESVDGITYSQIVMLSSELSTSKQTFAGYQLKPGSRYIRWIYQDAVKGNLALNNVALTQSITHLSMNDESQIQVYTENNLIYIITPIQTKAEIYNLLGQKILSQDLTSGVNTIHINDNQIVIVKIGTKAFKLYL